MRRVSRSSLLLILSLALAGVFAAEGLSLAGPNGPGLGGGMGPGMGMGNGPGGGFGAFYSQLAPEKRQAVDAIFSRHEQTLFDLRQELWARNTELSALMDSGQADEKAVRALTTQIVDLRTRQNVELKALREEISKETGLTLPGRGPAASCCDDGPGSGPGRGRGKGPGGGRGAQACPPSGAAASCPVIGGADQ
jgi:zinc resistance-associated protein